MGYITYTEGHRNNRQSDSLCFKAESKDIF